MDGYENLNAAAAAALLRINAQPNAKDEEYIGLIYQDPESGKFLFTDPQSKGARGKSKGTFRIPKGSLRALIHNHPEALLYDDAPFLSADDITQAKQLGVPSYIGVGDTLLQWTGRSSGSRRSRRGLTEEVLAQIPIEELKAQASRRLSEHEGLFAGAAR